MTSILGTQSIQHPNGTTAATINSNGVISQPTKPMFLAYGGSSNVSLANDTWAKVSFSDEQYDIGSYYDPTTNYRYTPQTSGYYFVSANLGTGNTADNHTEKVILTIYKNGSGITGALAIRDWDPDGIHYNDQINTSVIVQMNGSSDYIEAFAYIDVSSGTPRVESQQASMNIFKMTE